MRTLYLAINAAALLVGPAIAAELSEMKMSYPGVVALSRGVDNSLVYKSFPVFLPLYIFDGEPPGKSACDHECSAVWPIIRAQESDRPLGLWTIVKRDDGRWQWAYKGKPVYTYFEDTPNDPRGVGKEMDWYFDEGAYAYLMKAGVQIPRPPTKPDRSNVGNKMTAELLVP